MSETSLFVLLPSLIYKIIEIEQNQKLFESRFWQPKNQKCLLLLMYKAIQGDILP